MWLAIKKEREEPSLLGNASFQAASEFPLESSQHSTTHFALSHAGCFCFSEIFCFFSERFEGAGGEVAAAVAAAAPSAAFDADAGGIEDAMFRFFLETECSAPVLSYSLFCVSLRDSISNAR